MLSSKRLINLLTRRSIFTHFENKSKSSSSLKTGMEELPTPEYNVNYLCDESNKESITDNINRRKGIGDINKVHEILKNSNSGSLYTELAKIPNDTDPAIINYGPEPRVTRTLGSKREFNYPVQDFGELSKNLRILRKENLGKLSGSRSYMLLGDLADLEEALIYYTLNKLMSKGFRLISVPDILPTAIIERCGMVIDGERNQVYSLDPNSYSDQSLSGTSEMAIAGKLAGAKLSLDELPLRYAAVSRCYRAEASSIIEERGIFRVHQFTKVEMFVSSQPESSSDILKELLNIQEDLFFSLGLCIKVLDMPPHELGAQAYRKFDIEGWMPGRKQFGELSSCSNCTDYQSRRLDIKYETEEKGLRHVHTLNGTACAVPRMLIAVCETHQNEDGTINIPDKLLPFMKGKKLIHKQNLADMRFAKYRPKLN